MYPGHEFGEAGVHARVAGLGAPVAEGHDAHLHPLPTGHVEEQGPATVTLGGKGHGQVSEMF